MGVEGEISKERHHENDGQKEDPISPLKRWMGRKYLFRRRREKVEG